MLLGELEATPVKGNAIITVFHRSLRYSSERHGTHHFTLSNVAHFGDGAIEIFHIPWLLIPAFFLIWQAAVGIVTLVIAVAALGQSESDISGGVLFIGFLFSSAGFIVCIAAIVWNIIRPTYKGLLLVLASGDRHLFLTNNPYQIQRTTDEMFEVVEALDMNDSGAVYEIRIDGGNIVGSNLIIGDVGKSMHAAAPPPP